MDVNSKVLPLIPQPGLKGRGGKSEGNQTSAQPQSNETRKTESSDSGPKIASIDAASFVTGKGGGALRSIDQTFQINPNSGTMSLEFPLQFTEARSGFKPDVRLSYSSGSGNGAFGIGWGISLESISRKTSKHIPRYEDTDIFVLSGLEDLVPVLGQTSQADGFSIEKFRPRVEQGGSIMIVERWTSLKQPNDIHWRTISGSNIVKIFGRTDQSRIVENESDLAKRTFSWLLCEAYDPFGNAIIFSYKGEDDTGVLNVDDNSNCEVGRTTSVRARNRYIKSIKYGNRKPSRDMESWAITPATNADDWMFEVVFDYGEHEVDVPGCAESRSWVVRSDPFSTYTSGFEIRSYRLCRRILMFHHLEEKLPLRDYLIWSQSFDYDESPRGSFLQSTVFSGHIWDPDNGQGAYITESMAPCCYEYTQPASIDKLERQAMKPKAFQTLPALQPNAKLRWIDLHGEGSQGILVQFDGAWYYQRNENAIGMVSDSDDDSADDSSDDEYHLSENFGPFNLVGLHPNVVDLRLSYFEDIDGNGSQDLVLLDKEGRIYGYSECHGKDKWSPLREFPDIVNFNTGGKTISRIDFTGTGRADIVISGQNRSDMIWHENLGKKGFDVERRSTVPENMAQLASRDPRSATYLADLSGDGLTDVVRISNGRISYWPNLGYGRFGNEIVMDNCPVFDSDDIFDTERIRLLDIDGFGTTDILYLLTEGGAIVFFNLCGNSWSTRTLVETIPKFDNLSTVFVSDLLGKGTSCLCWAGIDVADPSMDYVIWYLDLGGANKPNLLKSWSNGTGLVTSIKYRPSTKFYLQDEKEGRPWTTKLPFPVQTVSRVVEKDEIIGCTRTTQLRYHDGYYDGREREFRGFGQVEKWESEELSLIKGYRKYKKPTCYSKLWYHTGAVDMGIAPSPSTTFGKVHLFSSIPGQRHPDEEIDAYRALKGTELRMEVYGQDCSVRAQTPYHIQETSYDIFQTSQRQSDNHPATFQVRAREQMTTNYERFEDDPRRSHNLVLETNSYGDVTKSVEIKYGRQASALENPETRVIQEAHHLKYTEVIYTNTIEEEGVFYKPRVASIKTSYVDSVPKGQSFDIDQLRIGGLGSIPGTLKRGEEVRTYYKSHDLTRTLEFREIERFSVVDQVFNLAVTHPMLERIYGAEGSPFIKYPLKELLSTHCAYVDILDDGCAWSPSGRNMYGIGQGSEKDQLAEARRTFFIPTRSLDPFGNISSVAFDQYWLLPIRSIDAVDNVTEANHDYRVMQPLMVTDQNKNRTQMTYDALGERTALARLGKVGEKLGDSMQGVSAVIPSERLISFVQDPSRHAASSLLGKASFRQLFYRKSLTKKGKEMLRPNFRVNLSRTKHVAAFESSEDLPGDILLQITYLDARGRETQELSLTHWDGPESCWSVTQHKVHDVKGDVVMSLSPAFSSNTSYNSHEERTSPRTINLIDVLGRNVGTLYPDHTWTKTCLTPWSKATFDTGDNVLITDPRSDPDVGYFFSTIYEDLFLPSWYNRTLNADDEFLRATASQSSAYANKPTVTHLDSRENAISIIDHGTSCSRSKRYEYDDFGNKTSEIDALGRIAERSVYDLLNRPMAKANMDTGKEVYLFNCLDKVVIKRNSRGIQQRTVYDRIHRKTETMMLQDAQSTELTWSKIVYGESEEEAETKNLRGQVFMVYDQSGVRQNLEFDFKGNCLAMTAQLAVEYKTTLDCSKSFATQKKDYTTRSEFDAFNRTISMIDSLGTVSTRQFDLLGGMKSLYSLPGTSRSSPTPHVLNSVYTADALPSRIDYGNSSYSKLHYDDNTRRILRKTTWRKDKTILEDLVYTYDCLGRTIREQDNAQRVEFFRNNRVSPIKAFWYDDYGRLVRATGRESIEAGGSVGRSLGQIASQSRLAKGAVRSSIVKDLSNYEEVFWYDDADNILAVTHTPTNSTIAGWKRTYDYDEKSLLEPEKCGNRLSCTQLRNVSESYKYDGDAGTVGCMTSMTGHSILEWDLNNKLRCSAKQRQKSGAPQRTWYIYNEEGERVRKVTEHDTPEATVNNQPASRKLKETVFLGAAEIYTTYRGDGETLKTVTHTSIMADSSTHGQRPIVSIENYILILDKPMAAKGKVLRYHLSQNLEVDDHGMLISYEEYSPFGVSVLHACKAEVEAPRRYRFAGYERDHETGLYACGSRYYAPWLGRWTSPDPLGTVDGPNVYAYVANDPVNWSDPKGTTKIEKAAEYAKLERLTLVPENKRRDAIREFDMKIGDSKAYYQHLKAVEQHIKDEMPLAKKALLYLTENQEKLTRKVFTVVLAESLGLIPFAGPCLKFGFTQIAKAYENNEEVKKAKEKEENVFSLGVTIGKRIATREIIDHLKKSKQEDKVLGVVDEVIENEGIHPREVDLTKQEKESYVGQEYDNNDWNLGKPLHHSSRAFFNESRE